LEAADFINRLIQRKPINRLGLNGPAEVKAHPWIRNYPWQKLLNKEIDPPFVPSQTEDNFDQKQQYTEDTDPELAKQNALLLRRNSVQELFQGYYYDGGQQNLREVVFSNPNQSSSAKPTSAKSSNVKKAVYY